MIEIIKARLEHADTITKIGKESFLLAHGHSASKKDIAAYLERSYTENALKKELENEKNNYHLILKEGEVAGFSNIILNQQNQNVIEQPIALLDRLYLSPAFHGQSMGRLLLQHGFEYVKENNQKGIWLAVWIENYRAISFYTKNGFKKVGSYDFKISETHANPNHIMYRSV